MSNSIHGIKRAKLAISKAFSFLFPSVLLSCYHHLKSTIGNLFFPAMPSCWIFEWCGHIFTNILVNNREYNYLWQMLKWAMKSVNCRIIHCGRCNYLLEIEGVWSLVHGNIIILLSILSWVNSISVNVLWTVEYSFQFYGYSILSAF